MAALIGLAGAVSAGAAEPPPGGVRGGPEAGHFGRMDPVAMTQQRLERLGKQLYLKPGQQNAWQTYAAAMTGLAQERVQEMAGWKPGQLQGGEDITTPDRLDRMVERMRKGADKLAKVAGETRTFYVQLSPEQKTIFDLQARDMRRERMFQHMSPGMPR